jgi:hypothetical protein
MSEELDNSLFDTLYADWEKQRELLKEAREVLYDLWPGDANHSFDAAVRFHTLLGLDTSEAKPCPFCVEAELVGRRQCRYHDVVDALDDALPEVQPLFVNDDGTLSTFDEVFGAEGDE